MQKFIIGLGVLGILISSMAAEGRWSAQRSLEKNVSGGDYGTVTSLLVMEKGKIVYEGYFNGASAESLHNTRSVTKTMTGMAVGAAIDAGLFSIDTPTSNFFQQEAPFDNPDPRKLAMTFEDMITMSGVLECNDQDQYSRGNESRMHNIEDWPSFFWDLPMRGYPSWSDKPVTAKYGRVFAYCSAGVEMLGTAVERASKTPFQEFVKTKFFDPLGISRYEWQENALGQAHKSGGLGLTTRGLAKFAEMQRTGGRYKGKQVLSSEWTQESIKPRAVAYADRGIEYGYLWWLAPYEVDGKKFVQYNMSGNGGNRVVVMPEQELVVVVTKTDYNQRGMHQATNKLFENEVYSRIRK